MKKVLCIAESCCDLIFGGLPALPEEGQEIYGDSFAVRPGGGANTPINLAKLGAPVTFLTRLGDDDMGREILAQLEISGVRVTGDIGEAGTRTAVSAVLSTRRDRGFASYAGTQGEFFSESRLEQEIGRADIVHTYAGYCNSYPIAALCQKHGTELSLDVSWLDAESREATSAIIQACDYVKVNEDEAWQLTGESCPEQALRVLAGLARKSAVVTLGAKGSIGMERGGEIIRQGILSAGAFRDSCGAGDAYAAGMLFGLSGSRPLSECMRLGAELSGQCVTWLGGNQ